jgi:hypothetical protein
MQPEEMRTEHNIIETESGAYLQYTKYGAGCMVLCVSMGMIGAIVCLLAPMYYNNFKGIVGVIIGVFGTLFVGRAFFPLLAALFRGKVVLRVENGYLINYKYRIPLGDIAEIDFGKHKASWSGGLLEDTLVRTVHKKNYVLRCYGLINDDKLSKFISTYIIPHTIPECKEKWELSELRRKKEEEEMKKYLEEEERKKEQKRR